MLIQNRYRTIELLGEGEFGQTFLAVDESLSPPSVCIIKQLNQVARSPEIDREALILGELGQHTQIPALLDYFTDSDRQYLVQEFIDGKNLAKILENEGNFSESQIWQLLNELLPVLKFIHEKQVIHRDIKPENIIRRQSDNRLFLVDFGAAKKVKAIDPIQRGTTIGSAEYVAPEQAKGKAVFASDLYSLGVTCIYLLIGVSPFDLSDVVNDCWVWRQYVIGNVSDRLTQILDKLIENAINRRFQSVDEVLLAIGQKIPTKFVVRTSVLNSLKSFATLTGHSGLFATVNAVNISPNRNIIASVSDDKTIKLWQLETGKEIATISGHTNFIKAVAFSPNGEILATGSEDKTIKLWDINTGGEIGTLTGHSHTVKSVAFSPRGDILASGSWDKTIKLWDVQTKEIICTLTAHQLQVNSVAFSPDGKFLASASFDRTVRVWEIFSPPKLGEFGWQLRYTFDRHSWPVFAVAFSLDGKILASGSDDKTIKLWDLNTGQEIRTLLGHSWSVVALAFSKIPRHPPYQGDLEDILISGSWDKTIKIWRVSTGEEIATLAEHLDSVTSIAVSPNNKILASGSKDRTVKLWRFFGQS